MKLILVMAVAIMALATACGSDEELPVPTQTPPTGGPDPMVVQTLADQTEPGSNISVVGYVVAGPNEARFCDVLLESFPPQCGAASVEIAGFENLGIDFEEAQGVMWTEHKVAFMGSWENRVFTPSGLLN